MLNKQHFLPRFWFPVLQQVLTQVWHYSILVFAIAEILSVLQARLFSYPDAARYRLGVNYQQLPTNAPLHVHCPFQRDGKSNASSNYGGEPNYGISSYRPLTILKNPKSDVSHEKWIGEAVNFASETADDDYVQPRMLWEVLGKQDRQQMNLVNNIAAHLKAVSTMVQMRTFGEYKSK
jgi:catalase